MPSLDIVTIGSATQDVFLRSQQFEEVPDRSAPDGVDACVPFGAKIMLDDIVYATGGGATNAAVTFANFGWRTGCLTRVGEDATGHEVIRQLEEARVHTSGIQRDAEEKTAYSVILLSDTGHRAILTYRGAALHFSTKEVDWKELATKWVYLTSLAGNVRSLRDVFGFARKTGVGVAWNPGNGELVLGLKILAPFLKQTAILILNREEAALLTKLPADQLEKIIKRLAAYPTDALVVTDGGNGAYVHMDGQTLYAPPLKAKRLNTTGAGDAFGSAFVAMFMEGADVKEALQAAMLNATSVIGHMGAKAGILKRVPGKGELGKVKVKTV